MVRVAAILLLAVLAGCSSGPSTPGAAAHQLRVLASTSLLADMAKNVAGERATVEPIAPAGVEVEQYDPRPEDAKKVADADVIFVNGLDLDAWTSGLLRNKRSGALVVRLTEGLPDIEGNPHMWFDLTLAKRYVEKVREALAQTDPGGTAAYAENAARYAAQLDALDAEIKSNVATLPPGRRKLVTSHDAFPYFARAYGFEIVGFAQPEPGKDPSPAELAALVETIRAEDVPAIFSEAAVSPRLAETLAREAGVRTIVSGFPPDNPLPPPAGTLVGFGRLGPFQTCHAFE